MKSPNTPVELVQLPPVSPKMVVFIANAISLSVIMLSPHGTTQQEIVIMAEIYKLIRHITPDEMQNFHNQLKELAQAADPGIETIQV